MVSIYSSGLEVTYLVLTGYLPRFFVGGGKMGTILKCVPKLDKVNSLLAVCISESREISDD